MLFAIFCNPMQPLLIIIIVFHHCKIIITSLNVAKTSVFFSRECVLTNNRLENLFFSAMTLLAQNRYFQGNLGSAYFSVSRTYVCTFPHNVFLLK